MLKLSVDQESFVRVIENRETSPARGPPNGYLFTVLDSASLGHPAAFLEGASLRFKVRDANYSRARGGRDSRVARGRLPERVSAAGDNCRQRLGKVAHGPLV